MVAMNTLMKLKFYARRGHWRLTDLILQSGVLMFSHILVHLQTLLFIQLLWSHMGESWVYYCMYNISENIFLVTICRLCYFYIVWYNCHLNVCGIYFAFFLPFAFDEIYHDKSLKHQMCNVYSCLSLKTGPLISPPT